MLRLILAESRQSLMHRSSRSRLGPSDESSEQLTPRFDQRQLSKHIRRVDRPRAGRGRSRDGDIDILRLSQRLAIGIRRGLERYG